MKRYSFWLIPDRVQALLAIGNGLNLSEMIRRAIDEFISRNK
jgi:hypothetical protein